jgi:kynurenine 3-monooxygenase
MPSLSEPKASITLVGGGLVGALLAILLGRRGFQVAVYERRPDMRRVEISAGRSINLALAERGLHALRLAGIIDEVEKLLIPMTGRMIHPLNGGLELQPYGQRPHEVIFSVSRGELNRLMLREAEATGSVKYHFNQTVEHVDLQQKSFTVRDMENGSIQQVQYDLLIGTDGSGSVVREAIAQATGGTQYTDWLDHDYKELAIPADQASRHQIEKNALHIWPRGGFMLIALPNLDGSFTVTLFLNKKGNPSFEKLETGRDVQRFFDETFPDAAELIPDLQTQFFSNPTGVLGTVRCSHWSFGGHTFLMGDAAHAIVPFHGQGMNAGFEDCGEWIRILDKCLGENRSAKASAELDRLWPQAIAEFELARRPNAHAIAEMALENYITMRDSVLAPDFMLKKALGFELERRHPTRFIPRYSMVMFHRIPYHDAWERGKIQELILDRLLECNADLTQVDYQLAEQLITDLLPEINQGEL